MPPGWPGRSPVARSRRIYTDEERARAYVTLLANLGTVRRTARDTGLPEATLREWKNTWEQDGPPDVSLVEAEVKGFVERAERVRDKALDRLERLIEDDKVPPAQLVATVGMLQDKVSVARGLATSRTETVHALPDADAIREALGAVFRGAVEAARQRDADIIEAEVIEEQAPPGELPPAAPDQEVHPVEY